LNLCIDIGNTRTKLGLFRENQLVEPAIWQEASFDGLSEWAEARGVQQVIVSSVVRPADEVLLALKYPVRSVVLDHTTPLPFINAYQTPQTLGKDRLAAAAGAQALYPKQDCVIIDCGTCIKYEVLTCDGVYKGGNIAPGLMMRTEAMHHFTARLPEVEQHLPAQPIGIDTTSALQNGAFRGALLEIEGFARTFQRTINTPLRVLLTGGDAKWIERHTEWPEGIEPIIEEHLTLIGLQAILAYNTDN
jgi:type III pantothenate kinase